MMSTGAILFGLALLLLVGLFIAQPLLLAPLRRPQPPSRRRALLVQKAALLEEIRSLDFDFETSKIPQEAYEPQRAHLVAATAAVLHELDSLVGAPAPAEAPAAPDDIEAAVARLRARSQTAVPAAAPAAGPVQFCPQCGRPVDAGDKFCAGCGQPLLATAAPPA